MQILRGFGNGKIEKFSSDGFYLLREVIYLLRKVII